MKIVLYLHVHQPWRLARFRYLDLGSGRPYFDLPRNHAIFRGIASRCYRPAFARLQRALDEYSEFRLSLSVTGTWIEQAHEVDPALLEELHQLVRTGRVALVGETYYHSLAFLVPPPELAQEVEMQQRTLEQEVGREDVRRDVLPRTVIRLVRLDTQQLLLVVPLVERARLVEPFVALEPDQLGVEQPGEHLPQLGLARPGRPFRQQRLLDRERQEERRLDARGGDVARGAEPLADALEHRLGARIVGETILRKGTDFDFDRPGEFAPDGADGLERAEARARIQSSSEAIERVAETTGFRDPERMRRAFIRAFGQPPQSLRRAARIG